MTVTSEHGHWHPYCFALFQGTANHCVWTRFQHLVDDEWRTEPRDPRRDTAPWDLVLDQTERS